MKVKQNIHRRKSSNPALSLANEQVLKLLDCSLDIICSFDKEGHFININAACERLWGYSPNELKGQPYMDYLVSEDQENTLAAVQKIIEGKNMTNFTNHYKCKDGSVIPMVWSAHWEAADGVMYCVARDGREKQADEKALRQSNERFELASPLDALYDWNIE